MTKAFLLIITCFVLIEIKAQSYAEKEGILISGIDANYILAKSRYGARDTGLFNDIQEVLVGIQLDESGTEEDRLSNYQVLLDFTQDINTNLYATRKIEDREYRRAIRLLPTIFYYHQKNKLEDYLVQNYMDAIRLIPFLSDFESAKNALIKIGLFYPSLFYGHIDDLSSFKYINSVIIHLAAYDPSNAVIQMDKNPFISDLLKQSSNPVVKKVVDMKQRLGNNTILYSLLDEIIRNSFNDSRDLDFLSNKEYLTQKILLASLNSDAFGNVTAMNSLTGNAKWLFQDYSELGDAVFTVFSNDEILAMMILCQNQLDFNDFTDIIEYMKRGSNNKIKLNTLQSIPVLKLNTFIGKMQKADLINSLTTIMEADAAIWFASNSNGYEAEKLNAVRSDWFNTSYNYEKDKQERQKAYNKILATTFQLNKTQLSLLNWSRNLNKLDSNIIAIIKSPIGPRFIDYLARFHPQIIANHRDKLAKLNEWNQIMSKLCAWSPNVVKKYLANENPISKYISESKDPNAKIIEEIYRRYKFNSKSYALIHKIATKEYSIERCHDIGNYELGYLRALLSITTLKNPMGGHSAEEEQNQVSLKYIRNINDNPSSSHPHLQEMKEFTAEEIYSMMVLGKEEIFQFAFDHLYNYFNQSLGEENFLTFLQSINYYKYRDFCVLLANFRKFPELLSKKTNPDQRIDFLNNFVHIDFTDIRFIEQAASICEFINNCENAEIQSIIQKKIYSEHVEAESRKDQLAMAVYSLLGSNIGKRAIEHKDWYIAMEQKYNKYTLSYINVGDLKNKQNRIIEVSYFYNDADGVMSFNSFISTFRAMPKWYLQDLGTYYYISSLEGLEYDILANKPQFEQTGQNAIKEYLITNALEPSIIVHRGHSYHSQKTIDQMIGSPKLIFMGSCGGYYKIPELLVRSPNAQILSTKQVGTMSINDPMLKSIHETFRNNQNIDWPNFWNIQEGKYSGHKDFKMYVPPHKNNGALFVNAFFKVIGL